MTQLNRGDFVKLASAFGGALVLGIAVDGCSNQSANAPAAADFKPNQWLIVHSDGKVTVFVSKSEMGQGVATGIPSLIAEELDVALSTVRIEFAPAEAAYDDPVQHAMFTGGSTSMEDMFLPLRQAGASARAMLVAAAAKQWGVDPATCTTKDGSVTGSGSNQSATYASLVTAAAAQPVPKGVKLKSPDKFTLIGKSLPRLDLRPKVNGSIGYGIDVRVPGMKFASIEQPPRFGATVDPGLAVSPDIVLAQLEGGVNYGLSMALLGNITIKGGAVQQHNFDQYVVLHTSDAPEIGAHFVPSTEKPTGIGEVGVPPIAPAVGNAIFALTGNRVRSLPFIVT